MRWRRRLLRRQRAADFRREIVRLTDRLLEIGRTFDHDFARIGAPIADAFYSFTGRRFSAPRLGLGNEKHRGAAEREARAYLKRKRESRDSNG